MTTYARSDTHFLLYIYDMLRLSLIERPSVDPGITDETGLLNPKQAHHSCGPVHGVLTRSARTALRLHETEIYDAEGGTGSSGWDTLARKWNKVGLVGLPTQVRGTQVQGSQAAVYKAVHQWREDVAREEDESTRFVFLYPFSPLLPTVFLQVCTSDPPSIPHSGTPPYHRYGSAFAVWWARGCQWRCSSRIEAPDGGTGSGYQGCYGDSEVSI